MSYDTSSSNSVQMKKTGMCSFIVTEVRHLLTFIFKPGNNIKYLYSTGQLYENLDDLKKSLESDVLKASNF